MKNSFGEAAMNILLINHYAGSVKHGMEYRPFYLAREWIKAGHRVRIVASAQSHIRAQGPQLRHLQQLDVCIDGVEYRWLAGRRYRGNGVGRVVNMFGFVTRLWRQASALADDFAPDLVIASSTYPLDIWPARAIARRASARLVFEVHDLWPLSPMELGGMSRWHPFIALLQAAENYACRHADVVVSILPKVRAHMEAHGMAPAKLHIVPNGINAEEWRGTPQPIGGAVGALFERLRREGMFVVGYAGTHGLANALEVLLDAAALMRDEPVAFVLIGGGPEQEKLMRAARLAGLCHVYFAQAVPKHEIPALLAAFDVAYIGWRRHPHYRFGISPNKLMDYMMAGRPVLHSVEAGNDPVGEAACGITVEPEDPRAIAQAIRELCALDPVVRAAIGQRGHQFVCKHLTYQVLGPAFLRACAET